MATAAWVALVAQVAFVAAWLVAGALEDGYSHAEQYVTELAADDAENPWIVRASLVGLGLSLVSLAVGARAALPRTRRSLAVILFLVLGGAATALTGVFSVDCMPTVDAACERRFDAGEGSWETHAHLIASWAMYPTLLPIPFLLAWATWPGMAARPALVAGVLGLVASVPGLFADEPGALAGLAQRHGYNAMHVGIALFALGLLVWSGSPRRRSSPGRRQPGQLEPFRFLRPWVTGEGENRYRLWVRPFRLPRRFTYERRVDYDGEAVWTLHDVLRYEDGTAFERTMVARPLAPDRMQLSGDDMPGGGETVLRPGGLDLEPCWILTPWWGLPWPTRWSGGYELEGSDAMRARFSFRLFGLLPMGELSMHLSERSRAEATVHAGKAA